MSLAAISTSLDRLAQRLPRGLTVRLLTAGDAPRLQALRQLIVAYQLPEANCYRFSTEGDDFVAAHLGEDGPGDKGVVAGMFDASSVLVGYGGLTLPGASGMARDEDINITGGPAADLAYISSAMVRIDWRGHGLHHALVGWRIDLAKALGRRHVVADAWIGNHGSWGHMMTFGMQGKRLLHVGPGLVHLLTHRRLDRDESADLADVRWASVADADTQERLFAAGFWAWRRRVEDGNVSCEFARPLSPLAAAAGTEASA